MATMELKLKIDPDGLLKQVEAMVEYLKAHETEAPDAFVKLAMEIGEINADTDITFKTEKRDGEYFIVPSASGDLARLIDAFKAVAS